MKCSVIGITFSPDRQKVLIIQRRDVPVWVLPGGGIDSSETPEQAIMREIQEETGLQTVILRKVGEYTPINRLALPTHVFECLPIKGTLTIGPETRAIDFHPIASLPKSFFLVHLEWLSDALKNEPTVIKKPISNVTYLELIKYFFKHPIHVIRLALSRLGLPINSQR